MRSFALLLVVIAVPAFATTLDAKKLERLLGLGHSTTTPGTEGPPAPSPLPWRLLGTLRTRDGSSLAAVECSLKSVTLAVGDIRDGVEVVSIEQQVLVVRREGRLEQVSWKVGVPTVALQPLAGKPLSRQVVDELLGNPADLLSQVQVLPAMVAGRLSGFRARWVKEGSLVAKLGLKTGDVITKVNGLPLDSMERLGALMQVLLATRRFEIELDRNGQRITEAVELDR
jgi:type II secretion system protein C